MGVIRTAEYVDMQATRHGVPAIRGRTMELVNDDDQIAKCYPFIDDGVTRHGVPTLRMRSADGEPASGPPQVMVHRAYIDAFGVRRWRTAPGCFVCAHLCAACYIDLVVPCQATLMDIDYPFACAPLKLGYIADETRPPSTLRITLKLTDCWRTNSGMVRLLYGSWCPSQWFVRSSGEAFQLRPVTVDFFYLESSRRIRDIKVRNVHALRSGAADSDGCHPSLFHPPRVVNSQDGPDRNNLGGTGIDQAGCFIPPEAGLSFRGEIQWLCFVGPSAFQMRFSIFPSNGPETPCFNDAGENQRVLIYGARDGGTVVCKDHEVLWVLRPLC